MPVDCGLLGYMISVVLPSVANVVCGVPVPAGIPGAMAALAAGHGPGSGVSQNYVWDKWEPTTTSKPADTVDFGLTTPCLGNVHLSSEELEPEFETSGKKDQTEYVMSYLEQTYHTVKSSESFVKREKRKFVEVTSFSHADHRDDKLDGLPQYPYVQVNTSDLVSETQNRTLLKLYEDLTVFSVFVEQSSRDQEACSLTHSQCKFHSAFETVRRELLSIRCSFFHLLNGIGLSTDHGVTSHIMPDYLRTVRTKLSHVAGDRRDFVILRDLVRLLHYTKAVLGYFLQAGLL